MSILSPLKRQLPVRSRRNNSPTTPSKRANRLPVLPELSAEHHVSLSTSTSVSSSPPPSKSSSTSPKMKRLSRYGHDEFGAFSLTDDFLSAVPRAAPKPPSSSSSPSSLSSPSSSPSKKSTRRSVCLSSFDIIIDISTSEPASPVTDEILHVIPAAAPCTPPRSRDIRRLSPARSRSPTPSLTSMSACSSTEMMPPTPGVSDDEDASSSPDLQRKAAAVAAAAAPAIRPRISKHPLMIRSTPSLSADDAHSADTFEFTLGPFSPFPGLEEPEAADGEQVEEREDEDDDALWYSRELSQLVSLPSPRDSSNGRARPDSLLPLPRDTSAGTADEPSDHSQIRTSKPLPAIPLDPTYPQSTTVPPPLTLRASDHPSEPSPLALPSPAAASAPRHNNKPDSTTSHRKSLTITVPRTLLQNKITVSDILDDINAWSLGTPSASATTSVLSPPRIPHSPALSHQSSEYDPVEFIVSYAAPPMTVPLPVPTPSTSEIQMPGTFLDLSDDEDDEDNNEDEKIRSRWSCSTIATLARPPPHAHATDSSAALEPPTSPTFAAASARLRLHLASVARRVRIRRAGWPGSNGMAGIVDGAEGSSSSSHLRSSSEPSKLRFGL